MSIQVLISDDEANSILRLQRDSLPSNIGETIQRLQEKILSAIKAQEFKSSPLVSRIAIAKKKRLMKMLEKTGASESVLKETSDMFDSMTPEQMREF